MRRLSGSAPRNPSNGEFVPGRGVEHDPGQSMPDKQGVATLRGSNTMGKPKG
jgi:hypothetical protein